MAFTFSNLQPPQIGIGSVAGLEPADISTLLSKDQTGRAWYTQYLVDPSYEVDNGVMMIPVAGPPGTPPKIVRKYAPCMRKTVEWTAERKGLQPTIPHWDTGNPQEIPAYRNIMPVSPLLLNDTEHAWRAAGTYVYFLSVAPDPLNATYAAGANPADITTPEQNVFNVSQFSKIYLRSPIQPIPSVSSDLLEGIVG